MPLVLNMLFTIENNFKMSIPWQSKSVTDMVSIEVVQNNVERFFTSSEVLFIHIHSLKLNINMLFIPTKGHRNF